MIDWKICQMVLIAISVCGSFGLGEEILERRKRFNQDTDDGDGNSLDAFFDIVQKRSDIPRDKVIGSGEGELDKSYDELMDKYVEDDSGDGSGHQRIKPPHKLKRSDDEETMSITSLAKELAVIDEEDSSSKDNDDIPSREKRDIESIRPKRDTGDLGDEQMERKKREIPKKELEMTKRGKTGRSGMDLLTSLMSNKGVFYDRRSRQIIIKKRDTEEKINLPKREFISDSDPNADWIMAHQSANGNTQQKHGSKGMHVRSVMENIYDTVDDTTHVFNHNNKDDDNEIVPVTGVWSGLGSRPVFVTERKTKRDGLAQSTNDSKIKDSNKTMTANGNPPMGYTGGKTIMAYDDVHEVVRQRHKSSKPINASVSITSNSTELDFVAGSGSGDSAIRSERDIKFANKESGETSFKTLSVLYRKNNDEVPKLGIDIIKREFVHVKRSLGDDGYVGCYADYLSPQRDLPVRAGIPFVTPNNCRSACLRTGYYYAGLQYGYLCFCGNTYGKYDAVPDSECSNACSGNSSITCGGYWRNSVYATAGVSNDAREGPIPFYLPPKTQDEIDEAKNVTQTGKYKSSVEKPSSAANFTMAYPPVNGSVLNPYLRAPPTVAPQQQQTTTQSTLGSISTTSRNQIPTTDYQTNVSETTQQTTVNPNTQYIDATTAAEVSSDVSQANIQPIGNEQQSLGQSQEDTNKTEQNKRLVLMHWAYLHPQHQNEIVPTSVPPPTPPLRIEPGTRVFKGEIKMKQNWYDDLLETQSSKYQILAGNIEQGLRNVYVNDSSFLKAEILAFREGLVNHNPNTVHKVIAEFALTFDQNAHSPDARLLDYAERKRTIDDMPVFTKSIKLQEYYFDPSNPVHIFSERQKYTTYNQINPNDAAINANTAVPDTKQAYATNNPSVVDDNKQKTVMPETQQTNLNNFQGKGDPLNQHVEKEKNRQQQQQQQKQQQYQQQQLKQQTSANNVARSFTPNRPDRPPNSLQAYQAEGNLEPMVKGGEDTSGKQKRAQPGSKPKVPYILRLFFWKDMVARKKRALRDAHLANVLNQRKRRHTKRSTLEDDSNTMTTTSNTRHRQMDINIILRPQNVEKLKKRSKIRKVKRNTKEPSDEKELRRSKRSK